MTNQFRQIRRNLQDANRRLLELEGERLLRRAAAFGEGARHPDRLERFLTQVVRLLCVERQDLERHIGIRHEADRLRDDSARLTGAS